MHIRRYRFFAWSLRVFAFAIVLELETKSELGEVLFKVNLAFADDACHVLQGRRIESWIIYGYPSGRDLRPTKARHFNSRSLLDNHVCGFPR